MEASGGVSTLHTTAYTGLQMYVGSMHLVVAMPGGAIVTAAPAVDGLLISLH